MHCHDHPLEFCFEYCNHKESPNEIPHPIKEGHSHSNCTNDSTCRWKGHYSLDDCIRLYSPKTKGLDKEESENELGIKKVSFQNGHRCTKYCVHGVNLLNRFDMDVRDIQKRMETRKEKHTKVEKRRRELINGSIDELEKMLPSNYINQQAKNSKGLILSKTIAYLKALQNENKKLKQQLNSSIS